MTSQIRPTVARFSMRRSATTLLAMAVFATCCLDAACTRALLSNGPGRTCVVLVDRSCSCRLELPQYRRAWDKVVAAAGFGDRVVLTWIRPEQQLVRTPILDQQLPTFSPLLDNVLLRRHRLTLAKSKLTKAFTPLAAEPCASTTPIFDGITLASHLFGTAPGPKTLLILSDMVNEDDRVNFRRTTLTPAVISRLLAARRTAGTLPDLKGVQVYVAGANGPWPAQARAIERFWQAYIDASGGRLAASHYGPVLIGFPRTSSGSR